MCCTYMYIYECAHQQERPSTSWNYPVGHAASEVDERNTKVAQDTGFIGTTVVYFLAPGKVPACTFMLYAPRYHIIYMCVYLLLRPFFYLVRRYEGT